MLVKKIIMSFIWSSLLFASTGFATDEDLRSIVNLPRIELQTRLPSFAYLPEDVSDARIDPDEFRCQVLPMTHCCLPQSVVKAIQAKNARGWRRYADILAFTACMAIGSVFSLPYYLVEDDCSLPNFNSEAFTWGQLENYYQCREEAASLSETYSGLAAATITVAAIAGQFVFSELAKKHEEISNSYQDALHRLAEIYLAMSEVLLKEYIRNLNESQEIPLNLLDLEQLPVLTFEEVDKLDETLGETILTFSQIKAALNKTPYIREELLRFGVMPSSIDNILSPLEQLDCLLNHDEAAKRAFLQLLLKKPDQKNKRILFRNVVAVIHDEDLKSIIENKIKY